MSQRWIRVRSIRGETANGGTLPRSLDWRHKMYVESINKGPDFNQGSFHRADGL